MVSIQKRRVKQVLFTLIIIVVIYVMHLTIQDFFKMFQEVDYEWTLSEFLRMLRGDPYWYEAYLLSFVYILYFYGALINFVVVLYPVRSSYSSLKLLNKYRGIR